MVVPDICPREKTFGNLITDISEKLIKIVKGEKKYQCVLFAGSGTAAVDACINSVIPENKKILIISNGKYGDRMIEISEAYGIEIVKYKIPYGNFPDVNDIEKVLLENVEAVSHIGIVHHETSTGMLNPIEDVLKLSKKYDKEIIVDTISSYAGIPISLQKNEYDYIIATSSKSVQGMSGISFIIFKKSKLEKLENIKKRSYYLNLYQQYDFFVEKNQMQFTPPVQVFYALRQAIEEYFLEGGENRNKRYCENWETLVLGLKKLKFKFLLPEYQQSKLLTAVIEPKDVNYSFETMHDYFSEKGFTIYSGIGATKPNFRVSNIGEVFKLDIENFLKKMKKYLDVYNIKKF